ncbi:MAG: manganese efflux pump [Acidimicrobiales bacterium]
MWWIPVLAIGVTSNLDNLGVGVSLGFRSGRVPYLANVIIALITMIGTAAAMVLGRELGRELSPSMGRLFGAGVVLVVGIWSIAAALSANKDGPGDEERSPDHAVDQIMVDEPSVSVREALVLGVALSVNNVGTGIGAGAAGLPPVATTIVAGLFSLVAIGPCSQIADLAGTRWLGRSASLVGGGLLVVVAVLLAFGV